MGAKNNMVSQRIIDIIIRAEDKASQVTEKVEEKFEKLGNTGNNAFDKVNKASEKANAKLQQATQKVNTAVNAVKKVGSNGSESFKKLSKSEQDALVKLNMLDSKTKGLLTSYGNLSKKGQEFFSQSKQVQGLLSQYQSLDQHTRTWGGSLEYAKTKMQLLGNDTNTLRGKIQTVGIAVKTYIGSNVSSVAQNIRTKLGGAFDYVKTKIGGLKGSFGKGLTQGVEKAGKSLGFLRSAASMTVGMIGYDLVNGFIESGRAALNANSQFDYFAKRLKLSNTRINEINNSVNDMQKKFKKVNMKAVAASAEELTVKLNLPKKSIEDTTQTIAVMSSAFVKEGRTQEDAILAVSDALDGQFKRMLELGITQDKLKSNGWDGDIANKTDLLKAMNKTLDDMGFTQTAKDVTNLDDAYQALTVSGGRLIEKILVPLTPLLMTIIDGVMSAIDTIMSIIDKISSVWNSLPDWAKYAIGISAFALAVGLLVSYLGGLPGILMSISAMLGPIIGLIGGISLPLIAIVGLIASVVVAVFELGKAFGWWHDVGSMLEAIQNNIGRLWDAFVNHPDVQGIIKGVGDVWNWLCDTLKPVVDWLKGIWVEIFPESAQGQWDVTRSIIDGIGLAFQVLTTPIRAVITVLQILYPYMQQFYTTVLVPLGQFLITSLTPVFQLISSIIQAITPYIMNMVNAFQMFLNGQIGLPELISSIFSNLANIYFTILGQIAGAVISWASQIVSSGVNAAVRFVGGILNNIAMLPYRVGVYLLGVASRIIAAGIQWVNNAKNKASAMVNGVISNVSQLPNKVYTEFMNIGKRISDAGRALVDKAKKIGGDIVNGILGAMGIHSPGIIQTKVVTEFENMNNRVREQIKPASEIAAEYGQSMVDSFGTPDLTVNGLSNTDMLMNNLDTPKMDVGVDMNSLNTANSSVINSYSNLANSTGASLQAMIDKDKNAYNLIRANDSQQLSQITSNLTNNMNNMTNKVGSSLNTMLEKNKIGLQSARNTTKTQLTNITNATVKANTKMIESWKHMKTGIVSAADKIKSDSTKHFNSLSSTIGGFYHKLQNPSRWGAGGNVSGKPSTVRRVGGSSNNSGFKRITEAVRNARLPQYLTLGQVKQNPLINTDSFGDYVTRNPTNNKFSVSDLVKYGVLKFIGKGAGEWDNYTDKHTDKIKDTSNKWSMKGPNVGKYATKLKFKVEDFRNGRPKISFKEFKGIAEDVLSHFRYHFYYDDDVHGNWINAFNAADVNCWHGSQIVANLARAMGLTASIQHGHWNQFGHFWATVNGRKMDSTGWIQQRNWTPAASHAGPAPRGTSFGDVLDELRKLFEDDDPNPKPTSNTFDSGEVIVSGEVTVVHEFLNLPENISADEVSRLVNETTSDNNWIKNLVKNTVFQKLDLETKNRIENRNNRARGI